LDISREEAEDRDYSGIPVATPRRLAGVLDGIAKARKEETLPSPRLPSLKYLPHRLYDSALTGKYTRPHGRWGLAPSRRKKTVHIKSQATERYPSWLRRCVLMSLRSTPDLELQM